MTDSERDLVAALRAELAAIRPVRPCDRLAEAIGLGGDLATREPAIARLAVWLAREAGRGRSPSAARILDGRRRLGHARLATGSAAAASAAAGSAGPHAVSAPTAAEVPGELGAIPPPLPDPAHFDWGTAPEHCRSAFLRGRFLARGSLSLASARTHLEFVVAPEEAPVLTRWLGESGLLASWRIRRGRGVVTWKSADTVGTFLRRIGAGAALLELEARQVSRAVRGDMNRILNAESANLQRAVAAASRQLAAIDLLEGDGRLAELSYTVRLVAEARREIPEATLTELAARLEIHRSAVQRALERLEWLALHDDGTPARRAFRHGGRLSGDAAGPGRAGTRTARSGPSGPGPAVPSGAS